MRVNALQRPKCSAIECPALSASPCNLHAAIGHLKNQIGYHGIPARVSASGPRGGGGSRSDIQLTHLSDHRINAWPASPVATVPASPAHSPSKRNCKPGSPAAVSPALICRPPPGRWSRRLAKRMLDNLAATRLPCANPTQRCSCSYSGREPNPRCTISPLGGATLAEVERGATDGRPAIAAQAGTSPRALALTKRPY